MCDDLKLYLPKFLSADSSKDLLNEIKEFRNPHHDSYSKFYSEVAKNSNYYLQGDGVKDLLVGKIYTQEFRLASCIVISNSCDIANENNRIYPNSVVYSPLISFDRLIEAFIQKGIESHRIDSFKRDVVDQKLTSIFYLPKGQGLEEDKIVFLDRLHHVPLKIFNEQSLQNGKIFSLDNFGFYLFVLKLSIHFSRIADGEDRKPIHYS